MIGSADATSIEVFYAPEDEPLTKLSKIYEQASRYIYVAVYGLTSPLAVKGLVEAKKRGLDVRVITDRQRLDDQKQRTAVETLHLAGIPILVNQHAGGDR
ncbi:phospholipase D-like domain-containing protein [Nitrospira lenta]|uniref:phospholipase D-like domain-containing protein n=1 Tax=Nitrospira lenta TaxID=1436998 RepID=UPI000EFC45D6|nr:phospholipase D-like domain-containing protein [Nitrospira lenta]